MQTTLISHPRLNVRIKTGTEGPAHDPYAYEETTITSPKGKLTLHFGLSTWAVHNRIPLTFRNFTEEQEVIFLKEELPRQHCGYTVNQLLRIARRRLERCRKCGSPHYEFARGYPGERLTVCTTCGEVLDSYFCRTEIE
jgi:hypothetical protein